MVLCSLGKLSRFQVIFSKEKGIFSCGPNSVSSPHLSQNCLGRNWNTLPNDIQSKIPVHLNFGEVNNDLTMVKIWEHPQF